MVLDLNVITSCRKHKIEFVNIPGNILYTCKHLRQMEINSFIMENFPFESIYPTTDRETGGPSVAWKDGEAEVRGVCVCVCAHVPVMSVGVCMACVY